MANTSNLSILFLGATGGCTFAALVRALNAGNQCIALVRTPRKLNTLLRDAGISDSTIASYLTVHTGNAVDVSAVRKALLVQTGDTIRLPTTIISGVGGVPKLRFSLPPLTIDQPTICESTATALVAALSEIYTTYPQLQSSKPLLCFISTGGMRRGEDDVTWLIRLLYRLILPIPWKDKKAMEAIFFGKQGSSAFRSVICVKPTLLTDGAELGSRKVRAGRKYSPAVGYTISRKDVGAWIYQVALVENGKGWGGEQVTLTY